MKRVLIIVLTFVLLFLVGCTKEKGGPRKIEEFNKSLEYENTIKYDLRSYGSCSEGHIEGFICIRGKNLDNTYRTVEQSIDIIKRNNKNKLIIIIDEDGTDSLRAYNELKKSGFKNVIYFSEGYNDYVNQMGSSFVPEVGCETSC